MEMMNQYQQHFRIPDWLKEQYTSKDQSQAAWRQYLYFNHVQQVSPWGMLSHLVTSHNISVIGPAPQAVRNREVEQKDQEGDNRRHCRLKLVRKEGPCILLLARAVHSVAARLGFG